MEYFKSSVEVKIVIAMILSLLLFGMCVCYLSSCNFSVNMVHIEGQASDVIDDADTNEPSAALSLPVL